MDYFYKKYITNCLIDRNFSYVKNLNMYYIASLDCMYLL